MTDGSSASTRPASYPDRGFQSACIGSGTYIPAAVSAPVQPVSRGLIPVEEGMEM